MTPGWEVALIRPNIGGLTAAKGKVPTPRGPIIVDWTYSDSFILSLTLPKGMSARVELPMVGNSLEVFSGGQPVKVTRIGNRWVLDQDVKGTVMLEVRTK